MQQQYAILQTLHVAIRSGKTFIGKVARLYQQSTGKKRIRAYRLRWLVWATVMGTTPAFADMVLHTDCNSDGVIDSVAPFNFKFILGVSLDASDNTLAEDGNVVQGPYGCYGTGAEMTTFLTQPIDENTCPNSGTLGADEVPATTAIYWVRWAIPKEDGSPYCVTRFISDGTHWISSQTVSGPGQAATSIPAYGPFAYVASFLGLLWFARRRKRR